jgi:hypothetical protein
MKTKISSAPYRVSFYSDVVGAHLLVGWPCGDVLEYFTQMLHQKFWSHIFLCFLSWVLESTILPTRMDLLVQRLESAGQPMGGHTHACQALLFQEVNLIDQGHHLRSYERSRFFTPGSLELGESAYEGGETGFMVSRS